MSSAAFVCESVRMGSKLRFLIPTWCLPRSVREPRLNEIVSLGSGDGEEVQVEMEDQPTPKTFHEDEQPTPKNFWEDRVLSIRTCHSLNC